jgi:isopenicillin N synthase-like dioxygenase
MTTIPVIDVSQLGHSATHAQLHAACRDWGAFYVINHGLSPQLVADLMKAVKAFFHLPLQHKKKIARSKDNPWGFYDKELTKNRIDWKQILDCIPGEDNKQWPEALPELRTVVLAYHHHCQQLTLKLLRAIVENLGSNGDDLARHFDKEQTSFTRLNYYPPNPKPNSNALGVGAHTDAGAMTCLLQDQQAGLEIYHEGRWLPVSPETDKLLINLGDIIQVWSNDIYIAALHRVITNKDKRRYSVPFFLNPNFETCYKPLPSTISSLRCARYTEINWGEFRGRRSDGDYADYGKEIQIEQFRIREQAS